jgi:hypothetical protein
MSNESKALELASIYDRPFGTTTDHKVAAELRRQHAEIESLRAQLAVARATITRAKEINVTITNLWNQDVQQLAAQVPDGWKLVPVEATREMLYIVGKPGEPIADMAASYRKDIWTAMLSAAPSQQAPQDDAPHCWKHGDKPKHGCAWCDKQLPQQAPVQGEPVAWMVYQGVQPYQLCGSEKHAKAVADKNQKDHDLSGSLASFRVKPLFTNPQQASEPMTEEQVKVGFKSVKVPAQTAEEWFTDGVRFAERFHKIGEKQ